MKRALVFPGQGSQMPGMGKELAEAFPAARLLFEEVAERAAGDAVCAVANDNCPGQIVVSGHAAAVERAVALAAEHGARRSIMLPVSAPFHSPLMQPAAEIMREALAEAPLAAPAV